MRKLAMIIVAMMSAFSSLSQAAEKSDCEIQADYAFFVATERDKGTRMQDLLDRWPGEDPVRVWARTTVKILYANRAVEPAAVRELYAVRCE